MPLPQRLPQILKGAARYYVQTANNHQPPELASDILFHDIGALVSPNHRRTES